MRYEPVDPAWDMAYEKLQAMLAQQYCGLASSAFGIERLQSYYLRNPDAVVPGLRMHKLARGLLHDQYHGPAVVFAAAAAEQFLKVSVLRPVVHGLVHIEPLADIVVESMLGQAGYVRYAALLSELFESLTSSDLKAMTRDGGSMPLLQEAARLQSRRNAVVHRAEEISRAEAIESVAVSLEVFNRIVMAILVSLGLEVVDGSVVRRARA